jgi:spermidine dehydrogenase
MRKDKKRRDRLGMDRPIDRRDFLNGAAMTAATVSAALLSDPSLAAAASAAPQDKPGYYPPALHGIRGSHPGAFETAHSVRDGTF